MKTTIAILLLAIFSPVLLLGQDNPLDDLLKEYAGNPGVYFLDLKTNMLPGSCEAEDAVGRTMQVKILSFQEKEGSKPGNVMYDKFFKRFDKEAYIGLVEVKSNDDNVEILVKKEQKIVSEFLIVVREESEISFIAATGNFDLKNLASLKGLQDCKSLKVIGQICGDEE